MNFRLIVLGLSLLITAYPRGAAAESSLTQLTDSDDASEIDSAPEDDQVRQMSDNGALTRKICPHTCEDRNLPNDHCKTWPSRDGKLCYVWDTRLPQSAVPVGK